MFGTVLLVLVWWPNESLAAVSSVFFADRSPTFHRLVATFHQSVADFYSRTAHNLTGGVWVRSHCYLLMHMCISAARGCDLSCDMAKYEESVLGKLSANLQQQAELLKH